MAENKSIKVTPEMIEAGLREYFRAYRDEDDPVRVIKAIYEAMHVAQLQPPPQESS